MVMEGYEYIGKVVKDNRGFTGKCIDYLVRTDELVIRHDRGGRIAYMKVSEANVKE